MKTFKFILYMIHGNLVLLIVMFIEIWILFFFRTFIVFARDINFGRFLYFYVFPIGNLFIIEILRRFSAFKGTIRLFKVGFYANTLSLVIINSLLITFSLFLFPEYTWTTLVLWANQACILSAQFSRALKSINKRKTVPPLRRRRQHKYEVMDTAYNIFLYIIEQIESNEHNLKDSLNELKSLSKQDDLFSEMWYLIGSKFMIHHDYPQAIDSLTFSLDLDTDNVKTRLHLALSYAYNGEMEQAIEHLRNIQVAQIDDLYNIVSLGTLFGLLGKHKKAIGCFIKAVMRDWSDKNLHYFLALSYYEDKQYEKAVETLEYLCSEDHDTDEVLFLLGSAYHKLYEYEEAIAVYLQLLEDDPTNEKALMQISKNYFLVGDKDTSMKYGEQCVKLLVEREIKKIELRRKEKIT